MLVASGQVAIQVKFPAARHLRSPSLFLRTLVAAYLVVVHLATVRAQESTSREPRTANSSRRTTYKLSSERPPAGIDELLLIQQRIRELREPMIAATVAVQVGRSNGSGVIVNAEGYVLTAAHVAGQANRPATLFLPNGRVVEGITLGMNQELDAGMIRITEPGPWPFVPLGKSSNVSAGQFCLATGHPGGYDMSRPPVLRWGRVLKSESAALLTDCTLVGGDSGGPLFDLEGRVIGIHSRIGKNLTINVHVPIDPYVESWDRLAGGETWGLLEPEVAAEDQVPETTIPGESDQGSGSPPTAGSPGRPASPNSLSPGDPSPERRRRGRAWLGVFQDPNALNARIIGVTAGSPAEQAGLAPGDVIQRIDQVDISDFHQLQLEIRQRTAGQEVRLRVLRGDETFDLRVRLQPQP